MFKLLVIGAFVVSVSQAFLFPPAPAAPACCVPAPAPIGCSPCGGSSYSSGSYGQSYGGHSSYAAPQHSYSSGSNYAVAPQQSYSSGAGYVTAPQIGAQHIQQGPIVGGYSTGSQGIGGGYAAGPQIGGASQGGYSAGQQIGGGSQGYSSGPQGYSAGQQQQIGASSQGGSYSQGPALNLPISGQQQPGSYQQQQPSAPISAPISTPISAPISAPIATPQAQSYQEQQPAQHQEEHTEEHHEQQQVASSSAPTESSTAAPSEEHAYEDIGGDHAEAEHHEESSTRSGYKVKVHAAPSLNTNEETNNKCNSEALKKIILDNIDEKPAVAKRQIQAKASEELGPRMDVVCSTSVFSYLVNTEIFCEAEGKGVTCLAYRQVSE